MPVPRNVGSPFPRNAEWLISRFFRGRPIGFDGHWGGYVGMQCFISTVPLSKFT